jgi:hypothetical protein
MPHFDFHPKRASADSHTTTEHVSRMLDRYYSAPTPAASRPVSPTAPGSPTRALPSLPAASRRGSLEGRRSSTDDDRRFYSHTSAWADRLRLAEAAQPMPAPPPRARSASDSSFAPPPSFAASASPAASEYESWLAYSPLDDLAPIGLDEADEAEDAAAAEDAHAYTYRLSPVPSKPKHL